MTKRDQADLYVPPTKKTPLTGALCGPSVLETVVDNDFIRLAVCFDGDICRYPYVSIVHKWKKGLFENGWAINGAKRVCYADFILAIYDAGHNGWTVAKKQDESVHPFSIRGVLPACEETTTCQLQFARHLASLLRYETHIPSLKSMALLRLRDDPLDSILRLVDHMTGGAAKVMMSEAIAPWDAKTQEELSAVWRARAKPSPPVTSTPESASYSDTMNGW